MELKYGIGDKVRITAGEHKGREGIVGKADGTVIPYRVVFEDGDFVWKYEENLELVGRGSPKKEEEKALTCAKCAKGFRGGEEVRVINKEILCLSCATPSEAIKKDTNPKDAIGCKKPPVSTIPWGPVYEIGLAMLEGACKYGRHNYRAVGVRASVYFDAAIGHLTSWWEGEDIDPDSGIHHLMKAAACLVVARDSQMMNNFQDDRPPKYPDLDGKMRRDPRATEIITKFPDPKPPYTQEGRDK